MKQIIFNTSGDFSCFILRLTLALIMLPHGGQKLFGWFGGGGYKATMDFFTQTMKLPWAMSQIIIFTEFFGAIFLFFGFCSKIWATGFICIMIGAIYTINFKNGFFMNWFGNQSGEGYEYHLLVIAICLVIIINGSGKFSVDSFLAK